MYSFRLNIWILTINPQETAYLPGNKMKDQFVTGNEPKNDLPESVLSRDIRVVYPKSAKKNGIEGVVIINFLLNKEGFTEDVNIEKSSGHDSLDEAALEAVRNGKFTVASQDDHPGSMRLQQEIEFMLKKSAILEKGSEWFKKVLRAYFIAIAVFVVGLIISLEIADPGFIKFVLQGIFSK
jgi:TonB family protein